MKATIWTLAALTGAACMSAGVNAQPPASRPVPPPSSEMPGDEPAVARPVKPATLTPRMLRKKEAGESPIPADDELMPPRRGASPTNADVPATMPARTGSRPAMAMEDPSLTPPTKIPSKPSRIAPKPSPMDDDEETAQGTATVRRGRRTGRTTTMADPSVGGDGPRKIDQHVSLEWVCPTTIKVRQPFVGEMVVRNESAEPALNVVVHNPTPEGFKIVNVEPKPAMESGMMRWDLGTLGPRQERRIRMEMTADRRGELACKASVSATTPNMTTVRVTEPQLLVKQDCPDKVLVGDHVPVTITVSNPGDGPTDPVVVRVKMSEGVKGEKGQVMVNEVGVLAAGETRVLKLICQSVKGGPQKITTSASVDGGLTSAAESTTVVNEPKMEVVMSGPKLRYLDRAATYSVTVANPGDAPANDVQVNVAVPVGFKVSAASNNGKYDAAARTILWSVGTVNPGEKKEVSYKCSAAQIGDHKHVAAAQASGGLRSASDVVTTVEGIASLLMELADVDDPIEVGAETGYEVRVTNHGSAAATNVEIRALIPKEMAIKSCQGPTEHKVEGQEVVFAAIPKLAPKADAVYRIKVKAQAAGDVRFRARLASDSLSEPAIGEEGTKVYTDTR
jgi:uncharacterized repeat protein (TIGR01451 family)